MSANPLFPCLLLVLAIVSPGFAADKIRLLIVTGGHAYETNQFHRMFEEDPAVTFKSATHPHAHAQLRPEAAGNYDVLVLYDMWQDIAPEAQSNLANWVESGKGLVALHHSIANYQHWPEYSRIIGGAYYLEPREVDGVKKPRSVWKHDVRFTVRVAQPEHPVTQGIKDFEIHDETYGLFDRFPGSRLLLTTDEPSSAREIGWAKSYGEGRVVYVQLGHDHHAFDDPNYRRLVSQAIRWTAGTE